MIDYTYNAGMTLADNCAEAILLAKLNRETVQIEFEGIRLQATAKATPAELIAYWYAERDRKNPPMPRKPYADA